jgi:protein translocase SecG subunit
MLAASGFLTGLLTVLFIIVGVLLVLCILLQKGKGGGLGAAFGGASSAFGTKTGDMFTWVTIVLTGAFLLLSIGLGFVYKPDMLPLPQPTFSPAGPGVLGEANQVRPTSNTRGVTILYSVNGQDFMTYNPNAGDGTVTVPVGGTLEAYCERAGFDDSPHRTAVYGVEAPEVVIPELPGIDETLSDIPTETPTEPPVDVPTDDAPTADAVPADATN